MSNPTMAQYEREMEGAWDLNRQLKRRIAELEKTIEILTYGITPFHKDKGDMTPLLKAYKALKDQVNV